MSKEPQTSVSDQVGERTASGGCSDFHIRHMAGVWYGTRRRLGRISPPDLHVTPLLPSRSSITATHATCPPALGLGITLIFHLLYPKINSHTTMPHGVPPCAKFVDRRFFNPIFQLSSATTQTGTDRRKLTLYRHNN